MCKKCHALSHYNHASMFGSLSHFRQRLLRWYDGSRRDLPWRTPPGAHPDDRPDPYHVLVSEAMLQQTQVATVIPYFLRFIERLPTVSRLASATEQEVLRLWQGLGYYSRARNLRGTAKMLMKLHDGRVPSTVDELLELPGIGRYTAGAIASLAYDVRAPILDGNVARVLCRLDRIEQDPRDPAVRERLWARAEEILPRRRAGDFNSALMELGATVCTPRNPGCLRCPVQRQCQALAGGMQESIPPARPTRVRPVERRWTICILHDGRWLMEQRPAKGRWAGMWQFVTLPAADGHPSSGTLTAQLDLPLRSIRHLTQLKHGLTHREYVFDVYLADLAGQGKPKDVSPRRWLALDEMGQYPLPRPHLRIAEHLATLPSS